MSEKKVNTNISTVEVANNNTIKSLMQRLMATTVLAIAIAILGMINPMEVKAQGGYLDPDKIPLASLSDEALPCNGTDYEDIPWKTLSDRREFFEASKELHYSIPIEISSYGGVTITYVVRYVYRILPGDVLDIQILQVLLLPEGYPEEILGQIPKELLIAYALEVIFQEYSKPPFAGDIGLPDVGAFDNKIIRTTTGSCWATLRKFEYTDRFWHPLPVRPESIKIPRTNLEIGNFSEELKTISFPYIIGELFFKPIIHKLPWKIARIIEITERCEGAECCSQLFSISRDRFGKVTMQEMGPPQTYHCQNLTTTIDNHTVTCHGVCDWSNFIKDIYVGISDDWWYATNSQSIDTELINNQIIFEITDEMFNNNLRFEITDSYGNVQFSKEVFVTDGNNIVTSKPLQKGNYICGVFLGNKLLHRNSFVVK